MTPFKTSQSFYTSLIIII